MFRTLGMLVCFSDEEEEENEDIVKLPPKQTKMKMCFSDADKYPTAYTITTDENGTSLTKMTEKINRQCHDFFWEAI